MSEYTGSAKYRVNDGRALMAMAVMAGIGIAGMPAGMLGNMTASRTYREPEPELTATDYAALDKAEEKRERKAAKRMGIAA